MSKTLVATERGTRALTTSKVEGYKTTIKRASGLTEKGYLLLPVDPANGDFFIKTPKPVILPNGDRSEGYYINVVKQACECFQWVTLAAEGIRICKHILWATPQVEAALRLLGLWTAVETLDEASRRAYAQEKNGESW